MKQASTMPMTAMSLCLPNSSMASAISLTWPTAAWSLGVACLFGALIFFVDASFLAQTRSDQNLPLHAIHKLDANRVLSVLRVAQGVLAAISTLTVNQSFELIQWARVSDIRGLSYSSFLAISPATGPWGMFVLATASFARMNLSSRLWVLLR